MRHGKKINHLGRKSAHRKAMLSNMANSLIEHKRINTTVAKAKALRTYVEPLISKSKEDSTHSRRVVFAELQNKTAVSTLFRDVAPKVANRPGGYTRIIRTGYRLGDNAEMCLIELVDFNELLLNNPEKADKKPSTRRSRSKGAKKEDGIEEATVVSSEEKAPKKVSKPVAEKKVETKTEDLKEENTDSAEDTEKEA
jgi:large subunit ribosomal protein L17